MLYRRLHQPELEELEKEFVRFLAANGLPAADWERLKATASPRVAELIDQFSDLVFGKVLSEVNYLEQQTPKEIRTYYFGPEQVTLNGLVLDGESDFDFSQQRTPEELLAQLRASGSRLKFFTAQRVYRKDRLREIFEFMEQGALISRDGQLYLALEGLK